MIGQKISQIWLGKIPENIQTFCNGVRDMNPGWEYKLWGEDILERYATDPYVRRIQSADEKTAFLVDRLRVLLLRDEGGWYADADCVAIKPLSTIKTYEHTDFVTAFRNPRRPGVALHRQVALVDNTVMGSAKNGRMINKLCSLYRPEAWLQNGHGMGVDGMMANSDQDVIWLNYRWFYADTPTPESVFLHDAQNLASWCNRRPTLAAV